MTMNLSLAFAERCEPATCTIRAIDNGERREARYGRHVQDRIKVRPGDLVAVDGAADPPEVVWRWWHGRVERIDGDRAEVSRNHTQPTPEHSRRHSKEMAIPAHLVTQVRTGDTVIFGSGDAGLLDVIRDGRPANPARLESLLVDGCGRCVRRYVSWPPPSSARRPQ
jgi:hypothetical protein